MEEISIAAKKLRTNTSLSESEIRAINSEINMLLKEKYKWECRIIELCGPNYRSRYNQYIDSLGGVSLPNSTLKVFGIAKSLPEYKDILSSDTELTDEGEDKQIQLQEIRDLEEGYFKETDEEVERNIVLLEYEKEVNLRNRELKQVVNKDISREALLDLIRIKQQEIKRLI